MDIVTVTEAADGVWAVCVQSPTPNQTGILSFHLTLDAAISAAAEHTLKDPADQQHTRRIAVVPEHTLHTPNRAATYQRVAISHDAWNTLQTSSKRLKYDGRGYGYGLTYYLLALFKANPTTPPSLLLHNWEDNRPDELTQYDAPRLRSGRFPMWARGNYEPRRIPRTINRSHFTTLTPDLLRLADHFIIAPFKRDQLNPTYRAAAVLEAIGLGYLIFRNEPPPHPKPKNAARARWRQSALARAAGANIVF